MTYLARIAVLILSLALLIGFPALLSTLAFGGDDLMLWATVLSATLALACSTALSAMMKDH